MSGQTEDARHYVSLLHWKARREERLAALVRLGEAAVPALVEGLDKQSDAQEACIAALVQIGPAARASILAALTAPAPRVRSGAVKALSRLGREEPETSGWLVPLLHDEDSEVRLTALQVLTQMGLASERISSALIEMSTDESTYVRAAAARALGALRAPSREAVVALLRVVAKDPGWVAGDAIRALEQLDDFVVPHAIEALASSDVALRRAASESLAWLGRSAEAAIPALIAHLRDDDDEVRTRCARALGRTGSPGTVVSALVDRLRHDTSDAVKSQAIRSIGYLGPAASGAVPDLLDAWRRASEAGPGDRLFRPEISSAIAGLGRKALEQVIDALGDSDPLGHQLLGAILQHVGWLAVPVLIERLRSGQTGQLIRALRELAPESAEGFISVAARAEVRDADVASAANHLLRETALRLRPAEARPHPAAAAPAPVGDSRAASLALEAPDPLIFSAYYPTEAQPEVWYTLLAYAHLRSQSEEVDLDARGRVDTAVPGRRGHVTARGEVARHTAIVIVPDLPGWEVNPRSVTVHLEEDRHRVEFRIRARLTDGAISLERATNGGVAFYVESILVGEIPLSIFLSVDSQVSVSAFGLKKAPASAYDSVFVSYAHQDSAVVDSISSALAATGMDILRDQQVLRSGEEWDRRLLELIDRAGIFQLYWSEAARQSPNVEREWRHALDRSQRPERFIRPIYWEEPMPPPPAELAKLHFAYYPLTPPRPEGGTTPSAS